MRRSRPWALTGQKMRYSGAQLFVEVLVDGAQFLR
jgi:hypothetical protein